LKKEKKGKVKKEKELKEKEKIVENQN